LEVLKKEKIATARELANKLQISDVAVRTCLKRLSKEDIVIRIKLTKAEVTAKGVKYSGRHYCWKLKNGRILAKQEI